MSKAKENDLMALCKKEIIPQECHGYIKSTAYSKEDVVPLSVSDEDDETDDD